MWKCRCLTAPKGCCFFFFSSDTKSGSIVILISLSALAGLSVISNFIYRWQRCGELPWNDSAADSINYSLESASRSDWKTPGKRVRELHGKQKARSSRPAVGFLVVVLQLTSCLAIFSCGMSEHWLNIARVLENPVATIAFNSS